MVTHLEDIGFKVNDNVRDNVERLKALVSEIIKNGTRKETERGNNYYVLNPNDNIEVWFFLDKEGNMNLTPFYNGKSRLEIRVIDAIVNDRDAPKIHCWVNPNEENGGDTQFVFEVPDFWLMDFKRLNEMDKNKIQLTAFAKDVQVYGTEEEFRKFKGEIAKTPNGKSVSYASNYFLPTGTFSNPMDSFASFAGKIKEVKELRNNMTGRKFYWMNVNTYFGDLDVVCADAGLYHKMPKIDEILNGDFYLTGKFVFDE